MTFARGAALQHPCGLFNSSLAGNVRRAIDIHEGDKIDEAALKELIRAAVALNLKGKDRTKPKSQPKAAPSQNPSRSKHPTVNLVKNAKSKIANPPESEPTSFSASCGTSAGPEI